MSAPLPSIRQLAKLTGVPKSTLHDRLQADQQQYAEASGRKVLGNIPNALVLVASDMHYWPGPATTAHRAFVHHCKTLEPDVVVLNGDILDGCTISRFPPDSFERLPTVKEELEACIERLGEIEDAAPKAIKVRTKGNHDIRYERKLAVMASEYIGVLPTLDDHFPAWTSCWSVHLNGNTVIKHRFRGGAGAPLNNVLHARKHVITGHLHSQKCTPHSAWGAGDTLYGVDTGMLGEPFAKAFDYSEDSPRDHRSGYAVLTYHEGRLMQPELVSVWSPTSVQFRGAIIEV